MPDRNPEPPPQDDPEIPGDVALLRSFSYQFHVVIHGADAVRPDRRAFQEITDKDTGIRAMSVYRADILEELGVPYNAIISERPNHLIVSLPTWKFRELGLGVVPAVENGAVGQAHCHVMGKLTDGRQKRLVQAVVDGIGEWIKGPDKPV